ncbi:MAG: glycosyltransferase family 39 protein, partial [Bacteroidota bacterium]
MPTRQTLSPHLPRLLLIVSFLLSTGLHWNKFPLEVQGYHTWRQSWTMLNARNFARVDANILNPRIAGVRDDGPKIHRLEFPVTQWVIGAGYRLFGEHILIARLFIFLIGIVAVLGMYALLRALALTPLVAATGAILMQFSTVFFFYTINPLPDFLGLAAGCWYLAFTFRYFTRPNLGDLIGAGAYLSLATLAKLPFIILSIVGVVYFLARLFRRRTRNRELGRFVWLQLLFLLPAFGWYVWVIPDWEVTNITKGIFDSHANPAKFWHIFRWHFGFSFPRLFFNEVTLGLAALGLLSFFRRRWRRSELNWYVWPLLAISVAFFSFEYYAIDAVHDYYLLPLLPWMYILVALGVALIRTGLGRWSWPLLLVLVAVSINVSFHTGKGRWDIQWSYCNEDLLVHREALRQVVPQDEEVIMLLTPTLAIFPYAIG